MRTPTFVLSISLCIFSFGLAGCGGGGGDGGGQTLPPTYEVTNLNNAGAGSLRHAVANAPDGAWIIFDPSLAAGTITLNAPIVIDRPIVIGGLSGAFERFTISGNNATRLFEVESWGSLDLRDLILTQGNAGAGVPDSGGAVYANGATLLLQRVSFVSCHAPNGGGGAIRILGGTLVMVDSAVTACSARWGGAMHASSTLGHVERSSFYLNTATHSSGGALHLPSVDFTVLNSTLSNNAALDVGAEGGAISVISHGTHGPATLRVWASTIVDNSADVGGGIRAYVQEDQPVHVICSYSIVAGNTAAIGPDLEFINPATAEGVENVIGVGDNAFFFNGIGNNQVGDNFTPLDPDVEAVSFISFGRAVRTLAPASPARNAVSTAFIPRPNGQVLALDQAGASRPASGAPDVGAIEH